MMCLIKKKIFNVNKEARMPHNNQSFQSVLQVHKLILSVPVFRTGNTS